MRILLLAAFLAPIVGFAAYQSGSEHISPFLITLGMVALCAQILIERRQSRD